MKEESADLSVLEPDQFVEATKKPLALRKLSRGETVLMGALRVYVLIGVPLAIYAFFHALLTPQ
jgi:hypothetical protein